MKKRFLLLISVMLSIASVAQKQLSDAVPQQVDIHIVKKEKGAVHDHIFTAVLERIVMGAALDAYFIEYDSQKKQLISIKKQQSRFQMK